MPRGEPVPMPTPGSPDFWTQLEAHKRDWTARRNMSIAQQARRAREHVSDVAKQQMGLLMFNIDHPELPW